MKTFDIPNQHNSINSTNSICNDPTNHSTNISSETNLYNASSKPSSAYYHPLFSSNLAPPPSSKITSEYQSSINSCNSSSKIANSSGNFSTIKTNSSSCSTRTFITNNSNTDKGSENANDSQSISSISSQSSHFNKKANNHCQSIKEGDLDVQRISNITSPENKISKIFNKECDEEVKRREFFKTARKGVQFIKHGKRGSPHMRTIKIDTERLTLSWKSNRQISLSEILKVVAGKQSKAFSRSTAINSKSEHCFTIYTYDSDRSVNLEAKSGAIRDLWIKQLNQCIENTDYVFD